MPYAKKTKIAERLLTTPLDLLRIITSIPAEKMIVSGNVLSLLLSVITEIEQDVEDFIHDYKVPIVYKDQYPRFAQREGLIQQRIYKFTGDDIPWEEIKANIKKSKEFSNYFSIEEEYFEDPFEALNNLLDGKYYQFEVESGELREMGYQIHGDGIYCDTEGKVVKVVPLKVIPRIIIIPWEERFNQDMTRFYRDGDYLIPYSDEVREHIKNFPSSYEEILCIVTDKITSKYFEGIHHPHTYILEKKN